MFTPLWRWSARGWASSAFSKEDKDEDEDEQQEGERVEEQIRGISVHGGATVMMIVRLFRHVRDTFRVLSGRDTEVRDMTLHLQKEIVRMQENTKIQKKICEETALAQVRQLVEEIKDLEKHLQEAETAAVEQVSRIANEAKEHLEADLKAEEELMLKAFEDNKEAIMEKILKYDASLESVHKLPFAVYETSIPVDDLSSEAEKHTDKVQNSNQ